MNVTYDGKFTRTDLRRAYALHLKSAALTGMLVMDAGLVVGIFWLVFTGQWPFAVQIIPAIAVPIFLLSLPLWLPYALANSQWKHNTALRARNRGIIRPDGIHAGDSSAKGDVRWEAFTDYKLSPGLVLLYQSTAMFNIFSRQMFATDQDWDTFVSTVQQRVVRRQAPRRYWIVALVAVLALVLFGVLIFALLPPSS